MQAIENFPVLSQIQNTMIQPQQMEMMMPLQSRVVQLVQQPIIQIQTQRNFSPPPKSPPLLRSPTERKKTRTSKRRAHYWKIRGSSISADRCSISADRSKAWTGNDVMIDFYQAVNTNSVVILSQIPIYIEIPVENIVEKRVPVEVEKV